MEHYAAWSSNKKPVKEIWSKPPHDFFKVNFDATIREDFSTQAAVYRNSNGLIIKMLYQVRPPYSLVYGEALVTQLASALATSLKLDKFILEGDSSIVVLALQNPTFVIDWHIENVINDTISNFSAKARKIKRSTNFCTHYVIYRATTKVFPSCISSLVSPLNSIFICGKKDPPPTSPLS